MKLGWITVGLLAVAAWLPAVRAAASLPQVESSSPVQSLSPVQSAPSAQMLEVSIRAERLVRTSTVEGAAAHDRFVPATRVRENERLYYTLSIRNRGASFLEDATVTEPLPQNCVYQRGTANAPAADVRFSADGGKSFAAESQVFVIDDAGVRRRATTADFTHIRLKLGYPLAPQALALARFTVVFK